MPATGPTKAANNLYFLPVRPKGKKTDSLCVLARLLSESQDGEGLANVKARRRPVPAQAHQT